ncbi:DUF4282 domain-containing protein [Actinomadura violacea]|uniref:DUF4282 domain-containing protein n=1 Tax=Actinomadura violacea TaxID=2819934 RepID=A0ABS3RR76_9ACTN|nr:DUF4282 domain-containing protein [Actinomadura violacea]MBO2459239.1 DUF4282 domain-containing protein [Actinomadura violacea]
MTGPRESRGVLSGLVDLRFRRFVTPRLISVLYVVASLCVAFWALWALLLVWGLSTWMGGGWWWCAPVIIAAGIAGVLVVRIGCEWVLMAFTRGRPVEPARPVPPGPTRAESRRAAARPVQPPAGPEAWQRPPGPATGPQSYPR